MMTVAYYRSSTDIQEHSVDMQRTMALKQAQKQLLVIEDEYPDPFVSARKLTYKDRPEMNRLIENIEKGRIKNLLVYKRDRLARKADEYLQIYRILKKYNVNVIFTSDSEHPLSYSPVGEFFEVLMAGVIQREGEQIAKRIRDSKISKFLSKQYAGRLPYGYRIDEKAKERIVKAEGEIDVAEEIYRMVLNGGYESLRDIKAELDTRGMMRTAKKQDGTRLKRQWTVADLYKILTHPLFMGEHSMTFEGAGEFRQQYEGVAIVTEQEWEKVQERLPAMVAKRETEDEEESIVFYAEGLLFCHQCKQPLVAKKRMRDSVNLGMYECEDETHKCRVRSSEVESLILERAKVFFKSMCKVNLNHLIGRYQSTNEERLEAQMDDVNREIKKINDYIVKRTDQFLREKDPAKRQELAEKMIERYDQLQMFKDEYNQLVDTFMEVKNALTKPKDMNEYLEAFLKTIDQQEPEHIRKLFQDIVAHVDVSNKYIDITFKHPYVMSREVLTDVAT